MLDIKVIRENPDEFSRRIATKGVDVPVDRILELDERRRSMITEVERIKAARSAIDRSSEIVASR